MSDQTQVARMVRVLSKTRTDLSADPPQLPESFVRRFPECKRFNEQMRLFMERLRNMNEIGTNE